MAIICFASLKGGVGKTSAAINCARAFTHRGAQVTLLDLDPAAHASNLLTRALPPACDSPVAALLLNQNLQQAIRRSGSLVGAAEGLGVKLAEALSPQFDLIRAGRDLDAVTQSKLPPGVLRELIRHLLEELGSQSDFVVVDTAPDFSPIMEGALAASTVAVVPVDSSVMSIWGLEQLIEKASALSGPQWCVLRNMVNRQASRLQAIARERLGKNLGMREGVPDPDGFRDDSEMEEPAYEDFVEAVRNYEESRPAAPSIEQKASPETSPIYLLETVIYRSELFNRLSHSGQTAFDRRDSSPLAQQYLALSRELERVVTLCESSEVPLEDGEVIEEHLRGAGLR